MRRYDPDINSPDTEPSDNILFTLQLPSIRTFIHKSKKRPQYSLPKLKSTIPSYKRHLTIRIPSDTEVKAFTPVNRIVSISNCADVNELGFFHGVLLKKGDYRRSNEDRFATYPYFAGSHTDFMVGIFDGHGGERVAQYLAEQFVHRFLTHYHASTSVSKTFLSTFETLEEEIREMAVNKLITESEGSTAIITLLLNHELHLAYIGDSEAVLIKKETAQIVELCPELDLAGKNIQEADRVRNAGGIILNVGQTERVQGELEVTRSFGATKYKPYIVAQPHLASFNIEEGDFLVMASDGLWKVLTKGEVLTLVIQYKNMPENEIAEKLYEEATKKDATDNITIVVVNLDKRRKLKREEAMGGPPAPTSRYAKQNNKAFVF
eukprot:TRINITY_DN1542_c0_g2_i8.p1 TRINITY_DN1542_c0_g2~~TRINITY_DN1542_c0_g2_i8.p1  ORF type:complete len:379 (+),score=74.60 TRINITY_DN1542_c0_g2_i8:118-1254(+)